MIALPNVNAIVLRETPARTERLRTHLAYVGINWDPFYGINAEKWGLGTVHPYDKDNPGGEIIPPKHVGLHLSHYIAWRLFEKIQGDEFTILEDDAEFAPDWSNQYRIARQHLPEDWDLLMLGSCCCFDKPKTHIGGCLFEVKYPYCTHAYIIRRKALNTLITTQEKSWAPIDLALYFNTYSQLRVYTILPRIARQYKQDTLE